MVGEVLIGRWWRGGGTVDQGLPVGVDRGTDGCATAVDPDGNAEVAGGDAVVVVAEELQGQTVGAGPATVADGPSVQGRERTDGAGGDGHVGMADDAEHAPGLCGGVPPWVR